MLSCRDSVDRLADVPSQGTPGDLSRHLSACPACAAYADSYRTTVLLVRAAYRDADSAEAEALPEELVRRILARLRRALRDDGRDTTDN